MVAHAAGIVLAASDIFVLPADQRMNANALFVVSPHLDDAVFSCGMLLALHPGSIVCTVFAGTPPVPMSTSWDRNAGFAHSDEALDARVKEDERALAIVGAHGVRLAFLDSQYETPHPIAEIAAAIGRAWQDGGRPPLVAPLGLYHSDHLRASDACCRLLALGQLPSLFCYEDALYRRVGHSSRERREALARRGFQPHADAAATLSPLSDARAAGMKWRGARAYRSQLRALADAYPNDLLEPERYWRLAFDPSRYRRASNG